MLGLSLGVTMPAAPAEAAPARLDLGWATASGALEGGTDQTGVHYAVVPPGGRVSIDTASPRDLGGLTVDGAQLDPIRGLPRLDSQGYDARLDSYDPALTAAFPLEMGGGQVLTRAVSLDAKVGNDGHVERYDTLHAVARAPTATEILPGAVGWAGRGAPAFHAFDAEAELDALATFDATGMTWPAFADLVARLDARPVAYPQNNHDHPGQGYEPLVPHRASTQLGSGYSLHIARVQLVGLYALAADPAPYTRAEKLRILRALVRTGVDLADAILGSGNPLFPGGGHAQHAIAVAAYALKVTGRAHLIPGFAAAIGGSMDQFFRIDQAYADAHFSPHDDLAKFTLTRRRTLGDQSGASATGVVIPAYQGGSGGVQGDWYQIGIPEGSLLTREGDGATATVTAHTKFTTTRGKTNQTRYLTLPIDAQPVPAFAPGDVVYVQKPAGTWEVGDVGWGLIGLARPAWSTPNPTNDYTTLRSEGAQALWLKLQGITSDKIEELYDFAAWADRADVDWPRQWVAGFSDGTFGDEDVRTIYYAYSGLPDPRIGGSGGGTAPATALTVTDDEAEASGATRIWLRDAIPDNAAGAEYLGIGWAASGAASGAWANVVPYVAGDALQYGRAPGLLAHADYTPGGRRNRALLTGLTCTGDELGWALAKHGSGAGRGVVIRLDTSLVTLAGAVTAQGAFTGSLTLPGLPAGAEFVACAVRYDGQAPVWQGANREGTDHAVTVAGQDAVMSVATGRIETAGDHVVEAAGSRLMVAAALMPV